VAGFAGANGLFEPADKVLLAVSGGADSTALMYAMRALKDEGVFAGDLLCAHINHQLRGPQADLDEQFVIAQAEELSLAVKTKALDVRGFARKNKLSIETAARKLRMESLIDIAEANECKCIATAHQKNDNAETLLHRLVRGTGFRGLAGIWPVRTFGGVRFVRPLLCVGRQEIIEYLRARNLKWRVDHTNYDCTYRRNFIRHRLLPALQRDCTGSIVEKLSELAHAAFRFHDLVCSCAERVWAESAKCQDAGVVLDVKEFSSRHPAVKVELIRQSLAAIGSGQRDLTQGHYDRILRLAQDNIGEREITLPGGFAVRREHEKLVFGALEKHPRPSGWISASTDVQVPGQTRFGRYLIGAAIFDVEDEFEKFEAAKNRFVEWFDLDKLNLPLVVRGRAAGDRFVPLGLTQKKKVGKFLTAAKVPRQKRENVLVVADRQKIIWVWPVRMSEQAKVTAGTRKILQLRITDVGEG